MDWRDIYRMFHSAEAKYTFFSSVHKTNSSIDQMLGHKISPNKFKKTEIIPNVFSDHNGMKVEINYEKKTENFTNMWRSNIMLLNNQWVKVEFKKYLWDKWKWKYNMPKLMENSTVVLRRKVTTDAYIKKKETS